MFPTILPDVSGASQRTTLDIIRRAGVISSAEIARTLSFQRSSILYIVKELTARDCIADGGRGKSTASGGKPPSLLRLNPAKGSFLGVDLGPAGFRACVRDFAFEEIASSACRAEAAGLFGDGCARLAAEIDGAFLKAGIPAEKRLGVGVALPGLVERGTGKVLYSISLGLEDFPLREMLEERLGIPVRVANDANAGALALRWTSSGRTAEDSVFLIVNESYTGLGAGLVLGGKIYEGANGTAGEIVPQIPPLSSLIRKARELGKKPAMVSPEAGTQEIAAAYAKGCSVSAYVVETLGAVAAREITRLIGIVDPAVVTLGGDILPIAGPFIDAARRRIESFHAKFLPRGVRIPMIVASPLGEATVNVGAAALPAYEAFSPLPAPAPAAAAALRNED